MSKITLTTVQALLTYLDRQYVVFDDHCYKLVNGLFGLFGHGNISAFGEALQNYNLDLRYYPSVDEQSMVHSAAAYAKEKKRLQIMACTSSIGPGALNMLTAATAATVNRLPVLLLPSDTFAGRQPDPVLQQIEQSHDYTITANDCFKPIAKYWDRITRPEQLMISLNNAIRTLTSPVDAGAVCLSLPQDVQSMAYDYPKSFFAKNYHYIYRTVAPSKLLKQCTQMILRAKRPMIIAGGGIKYSLAEQELANFSNTFSIPVAETVSGKSSLTFDHAFNIGGIGVNGSSSANSIANNADLIIAIGTRLTDITTSSKTGFKNAKIINVNVSPADSWKLDSLSVVADAKLFLESLHKELVNENYQTSSEFQKSIAIEKQHWLDKIDSLVINNYKDQISQQTVIRLLNDIVTEDDLIIASSGSLPSDLHKIWQSKGINTYHLDAGFACMGYEVAAGLGAAIARTKGEIYVLCGDGSFLMNHSQLYTSIREQVKLNIIVFDNLGFQDVNRLQKSLGQVPYGNAFNARDPKTGKLDADISKIDFSKYAKALGASCFSADNVVQVKQALHKSRNINRSVVIDVKVSVNDKNEEHGSFWRVDVAEISNSLPVRKKELLYKEKIELARDF